MTSANIRLKCRACICTLDAAVGSYDMRKLPTLAHKFITCTGLIVFEEDEEQPLPSELCQACHDQLEQFYAFRVKCIAADIQWRAEILASSDAENPKCSLDAAAPKVSELDAYTDKKVRKRRGDKLSTEQLANEETEIELPETEATVLDTIGEQVYLSGTRKSFG